MRNRQKRRDAYLTNTSVSLKYCLTQFCSRSHYWNYIPLCVVIGPQKTCQIPIFPLYSKYWDWIHKYAQSVVQFILPLLTIRTRNDKGHKAKQLYLFSATALLNNY